MPLNRRTLIKNSLRALIFILLASGYGLRKNIKTEKIQLRFASLPPSFRGLRIIQISDLHAGFWVGRSYLTQVVAQINSMAKDIVVVTGDILTGSINALIKRWFSGDDDAYLAIVIDVLSQLKPNTLKLAVLGNHDQVDGPAKTQVITDGLHKIGFKVLRNESIAVGRGREHIYFAGLDDLWFSYDLSKALADIPEKAFKILLSHNPDITTEIHKKMRIDLTLCGHTHGGQVNIQPITNYFMPINNPQRYLAGLVRETYGYTYVNRGIGTLVFPLRLNAPPEITYFLLT